MGNKDHERALFQRFRECYQHFPHGEIKACENPDFVVQTQCGDIGVEITMLHHEMPEGKSPLQEQEALRRLVLDKAKKLYDEQGGNPVHVSVHFKTSYRIRKKDVNVFAEKILELLRRELAGERILWGNEDVDDADEDDYPPEFLWRLSLGPFKRLTKSTWSQASAGFAPKLEPALIQRILDKKSSRCTSYRERCQELWLVIAVEGFATSSLFIVEPEIAKHPFRCAFEKAFLFQVFERRVHELTILRNEGAYDGGL